MRARHPIHSSSEGVPPGGLVSVRRSSPTSRNTRVRRATAVSALLVALAIGAQAEEAGSRGIVRVRAEYGPDYSKLQRVALVIGNSRYAHGELANAVNDARDMTSALEGLGFTVVAGYDLDKRGINKKIRDFGKRLEQSKGVGLFYYAGHGAQYRGRDYLIPIDADIEAEDEINDGAVDATGVLEKMEVANNRLNIVILDACRDNPFPRAFSRGGGGGWSGNLATNMPSGSRTPA